MNALAKVLVVLVLILSVGLAVSQMVLHGKREHYGELYVNERKARNQLEEELGKARGEFDDLTVKFDRLRESKDAQIQSLQTSLANEQARAGDLNAQVEQLTTGVQRLTDRANKLEADIATRDATIEQLRSTVAEREQTIQENLNKIDQLQNTLAAREGTIDDLEHEVTEQKKAYRQLAQSEERLQAIVGELVERGVHVPPAPLPVINGRIVRVDEAHGVAVVDKGSEAGVKPNTEFTVYDDAGYIARLVIHDVQPQVSAGRIRLLVAERSIRMGDKVTTEIP